MKKLMSLLVLASVGMFVLGCSEDKGKAKTDGTKAKPAETTKPADTKP